MTRIAVIATMFGEVVEQMIRYVEEYARSEEVEIVGVYRVPGLLEVPLVVKKVLDKADVDGVVVLGAVFKETSLEEYLFNQVVNKLLDLSLRYGKPIGFGVSGPGIYWDRELVKEGGRAYAKMALEAVRKTLETLRSLDEGVPNRRTINTSSATPRDSTTG